MNTDDQTVDIVDQLKQEHPEYVAFADMYSARYPVQTVDWLS